MVIPAARMGKLYRGGQGFPCKGQNSFLAKIRTILREKIQCSVFVLLEFRLCLSCSVSLGRIEGHKGKEPSVLCLSFRDFVGEGLCFVF